VQNEGYKIKTVEFDYLSRRMVTREFKVIKNTAGINGCYCI